MAKLLTSRTTKEHGLRIQSNQLKEWKARLSAGCYKALVQRIALENGYLTEDSTLYDVFRGDQFLDVISNWRPQ